VYLDQNEGMKNPLICAPVVWHIDDQFDDEMNVEILTPDGGIVAEVYPRDGEGLDEWGQESLTAAKMIRSAPVMLAALKHVRQIGYASKLHKTSDTVLACVRIAEQAILEAEK
jgi:hypothetical protein